MGRWGRDTYIVGECPHWSRDMRELPGVIILGGNGYTGSALHEAMLRAPQRCTVHSVDLCCFGRNLGMSQEVDIFDLDTLEGYRSVILLAGYSSVKMCSSDPEGSWRGNVDGFRHILGLIRGGQRLIFASSASIYPVGVVDAHEGVELPVRFRTEYDMQKMVVEMLAEGGIGRGKEVIGLRMGTVNGPSPNTRSDLLLNSMVRSALDSGVVKVRGPQVRRSVLGINDFARAVMEVALWDGAPVGMYNLASFSGTVGEFGRMVSEMTGARLEVDGGADAPFDFTLDSRRFSETFRFSFEERVGDVISGLIRSHPGAVYGERGGGCG